MYKSVDGVKIEMTAEEIAQHNKDIEGFPSQADINLRNLRIKRNALLAQSDWMANSDVTMSDEWKTYRQALRDITNGITTVAQVDEKLKKDDNGKLVNFPTAPSE